jgi:glyoxylase-like metal-dependent hydrolase (beta-lactamase superfamily II)
VSNLEEIQDGVYRLGTQWVNWYLCEADGRVTVIDCGFRRYYEQLSPALGRLGLGPEAIESVVLTHYHPDHVGSAQRISAETGAAVHAPEGDAEGVRAGKGPPPPGLLGSVWRPVMARYLTHAALSGGTGFPAVPEARAYADGDLIDGPVPLRAVATPGHTAGHCALLAEDRGVLFAGDSIATVDFFSRQERPALLAFAEDSADAERSLGRLEGLQAGVLAPGHGPPFRGEPAEAVRQARA